MEPHEKPGAGADASEIAEWMEEDFAAALTEGISNAADSDEDVE